MFSKQSLHISGLLLCLTFGKCCAERGSLPVDWDLRLGPSLTGVTRELIDRLDRPEMGLQGGVGTRWPTPASFWDVQAELLMAERRRGFVDPDQFRRSLVVLYAQSALLARGPLGGEGKLRPYALAGPYVAWRLWSHIAPGSYVGDEPVNPGDVRVRDAGAIIGVGSDLVSGAGRASFEVRLSLGLMDVLEDRSGFDGAYRTVTLLLAFTPSR